MTTRSYYVPRNQIGHYIINTVIDKVSCSIGDIVPYTCMNVMRFTITCRDKDIPTVERIIGQYVVQEGDK